MAARRAGRPSGAARRHRSRSFATDDPPSPPRAPHPPPPRALRAPRAAAGRPNEMLCAGAVQDWRNVNSHTPRNTAECGGAIGAYLHEVGERWRAASGLTPFTPKKLTAAFVPRASGCGATTSCTSASRAASTRRSTRRACRAGSPRYATRAAACSSSSSRSREARSLIRGPPRCSAAAPPAAAALGRRRGRRSRRWWRPRSRLEGAAAARVRVAARRRLSHPHRLDPAWQHNHPRQRAHTARGARISKRKPAHDTQNHIHGTHTTQHGTAQHLDPRARARAPVWCFCAPLAEGGLFAMVVMMMMMN